MKAITIAAGIIHLHWRDGAGGGGVWVGFGFGFGVGDADFLGGPGRVAVIE
jgi:hypothetical protein